MLDEGRFASVRELGDAERVGHSYVFRVLRLTLLAPDIVERIPRRAADGKAGAVPEALPGGVG
jgi:hypothetical protein